MTKYQTIFALAEYTARNVARRCEIFSVNSDLL